MAETAFTPGEIDRRIASLEFKTQHTAACQRKNGYEKVVRTGQTEELRRMQVVGLRG